MQAYGSGTASANANVNVNVNSIAVRASGGVGAWRSSGASLTRRRRLARLPTAGPLIRAAWS